METKGLYMTRPVARMFSSKKLWKPSGSIMKRAVHGRRKRSVLQKKVTEYCSRPAKGKKKPSCASVVSMSSSSSTFTEKSLPVPWLDTGHICFQTTFD